jgi:hypothetical protein
MARVLFVGQQPETVDFTNPVLPPGMNAERIHAGNALAAPMLPPAGSRRTEQQGRASIDARADTHPVSPTVCADHRNQDAAMKRTPSSLRALGVP